MIYVHIVLVAEIAAIRIRCIRYEQTLVNYS